MATHHYIYVGPGELQGWPSKNSVLVPDPDKIITVSAPAPKGLLDRGMLREVEDGKAAARRRLADASELRDALRDQAKVLKQAELDRDAAQARAEQLREELDAGQAELDEAKGQIGQLQEKVRRAEAIAAASADNATALADAQSALEAKEAELDALRAELEQVKIERDTPEWQSRGDLVEVANALRKAAGVGGPPLSKLDSAITYLEGLEADARTKAFAEADLARLS